VIAGPLPFEASFFSVGSLAGLGPLVAENLATLWRISGTGITEDTLITEVRNKKEVKVLFQLELFGAVNCELPSTDD
jgi:hypothetical protein